MEREHVGHTAVGHVIVDVVPRIFVDDELRVLDALQHVGIERYRADRLGAGRHNQRRRLDGVNFVHEIRVGPVADEPREEGEIVLADFVEHPRDQFRIGLADRQTVVDRFTEHRAHAALRRVAQPALALLAFEARRRAEQHEALDPPGMMDRELLRRIAAGRYADDVRGGKLQVVKQLERILHQALFVERQILRRNLRRAVAARIDADDAETPREARHHRVEAPRAAHGGMQHHERLGRAPRVGEVVDVIRDLDAVAGFESLFFHALVSG